MDFPKNTKKEHHCDPSSAEKTLRKHLPGILSPLFGNTAHHRELPGLYKVKHLKMSPGDTLDVASSFHLYTHIRGCRNHQETLQHDNDQTPQTRSGPRLTSVSESRPQSGGFWEPCSLFSTWRRDTASSSVQNQCSHSHHFGCKCFQCCQIYNYYHLCSLQFCARVLQSHHTPHLITPPL